jgi:hypothetical protein
MQTGAVPAEKKVFIAATETPRGDGQSMSQL